MSTRKLNPEVAEAMLRMRQVPQIERRAPLPQHYEDAAVDWRKKGRLPKPDFIPNGKRLVILQEPVEKTTKSGLIIVPDMAAEKYRPTKGIVVGYGTGYEPDDPEWYEWEHSQDESLHMPTWRPPFPIGTGVIWGRYHGDIIVSTTVQDDWWDENEDRDQGVPVIIIHVKDVLGLARDAELTLYPEEE